MSASPLVTHHANLGSPRGSVQTYADSGHVVLDVNEALTSTVNRMSARAARALAAALLAAVRDIEVSE